MLLLKTQTKSCKRCGKVFSPNPRSSWKQWTEQQYCSNICRAFRKRNGKYVTCPTCGKKTYFKLMRLKKKARFCSRICKYESMKGKSIPHLTQFYQKGELNQRWKGGLENRKLITIRYRARKRNAMGFFTIQQWEEKKLQFDNRCPMCGKREPEIKLTIDHIIPLSRGGSNDIENIQPLCGGCNCSKQAKTIKFEPVKEK